MVEGSKDGNGRNPHHEGEEPESVVLLGVGTGESHKDLLTAATPEFIEELEEIIAQTDKLFIREEHTPTTALSSFEDVEKTFEVLDGKGERAFLLGQLRASNNVVNFVIQNTRGHGILTFKKYGLLNQNVDIEGAGILNFTSIHHPYNGGYSLSDKWKRLLLIRPTWVPFLPCLLGKMDATLEFANLDGTPSGTITWRRWLNLGLEERTLCVHFIPGLDRKAKYMMFAASLVPFTNYFTEPGRRRSIIVASVFYFIFAVVVTLIVVIPIVI